jgi:hypothetical protein
MVPVFYTHIEAKVQVEDGGAGMTGESRPLCYRLSFGSIEIVLSWHSAEVINHTKRFTRMMMSIRSSSFFPLCAFTPPSFSVSELHVSFSTVSHLSCFDYDIPIPMSKSERFQ